MVAKRGTSIGGGVPEGDLRGARGRARLRRIRVVGHRERLAAPGEDEPKVLGGLDEARVCARHEIDAGQDAGVITHVGDLHAQRSGLARRHAAKVERGGLHIHMTAARDVRVAHQLHTLGHAAFLDLQGPHIGDARGGGRVAHRNDRLAARAQHHGQAGRGGQREDRAADRDLQAGDGALRGPRVEDQHVLVQRAAWRHVGEGDRVRHHVQAAGLRASSDDREEGLLIVQRVRVHAHPAVGLAEHVGCKVNLRFDGLAWLQRHRQAAHRARACSQAPRPEALCPRAQLR